MAKKKQKISELLYEKMDYREYEDELSDSEREWVEQFYHEYYANLMSEIPEEDRIQTEGYMLIEGYRRYNQLYRGIFEVAEATKTLEYSDDDQEFMEDASNEWEWRDALKIGGYEMASQTIIVQAMNELRRSHADWSKEWPAILARMYVKMNEMRKEYNREQRKQNEKA